MKKVKIKLKFVGFDDWDRPVFQEEGRNHFFGSTNFLGDGPGTVNGVNVVDFFKEKPKEIEYFGREFNCEPNGGSSDDWELEFVKQEENGKEED